MAGQAVVGVWPLRQLLPAGLGVRIRRLLPDGHFFVEVTWSRGTERRWTLAANFESERPVGGPMAIDVHGSGMGCVLLFPGSPAGEEEDVAQFDVYKDHGGQYRWRLQVHNYEIIAESAEAYRSKAECEGAIELLKRMAPGTAVNDLTCTPRARRASTSVA